MFSTANSSSEGRLKSEHAKLRLFQRQIAETSVEQVIEKGKKVHQTFFRDLRCDRFKHIFEGQVVVTERKDGSVVTTYVVLPPLSPIYIDPPTSDAHMRRSRHLSVYPERATAHTIFVIDSSASMNACDVSDAKTRWERGFRAIATDFIAERICQGTRQDTDVFSMITFSAPKGVVPPQSAQELHYQLRSYAQVVFERQPQDPLLINRVVDAYRNLKVQSHGMYLPGIWRAGHLLQKDRVLGGSYPVTVVFFSDGRPSEAKHLHDDLVAAVKQMCVGFGERLSFVALPRW